MRKWILAGTALTMVATCAVARERQRLPRECRKEIVELCGRTMDRGKMRECLKEKGEQLSADCSEQVTTRFRDRMGKAERKAQPKLDTEMIALGAIEHSYGRGPLQTLDFYKATNRDAPLVIFVHGGGWKRGDKRNATGAEKIKHFREAGYAFASINYPLVPAATVEQQASDVAEAIAYLRGKAASLGFDPQRIVLMGHSAGAHLSALVGTDPQYLQKAGLRFGDLRGVVPLDGAAYDVPAQMTDGPKIMQDTYQQAFGTDPARQRALSPTLHADGPNAPSFLIVHVDREDGKRQSEALASALRNSGTRVQINAFEGKGLKGHMEINRKLGAADYPATAVVDAWLKGVFGN